MRFGLLQGSLGICSIDAFMEEKEHGKSTAEKSTTYTRSPVELDCVEVHKIKNWQDKQVALPFFCATVCGCTVFLSVKLILISFIFLTMQCHFRC